MLDSFGERALVAPPGLIVGPHDPTDRFTYWPRRIAEGGHVLAPAPPDAPAVHRRARPRRVDLAAIEAGRSGVYNATGDDVFARLLEACQRVSGNVDLVWVASERLAEAGVGE